jgi:hypothetical protein
VIRNASHLFCHGCTHNRTVQVGFLTLTVAHKILTPSGEPDVYRLTGRNGAQYDFVPHGGLHRVA